MRLREIYENTGRIVKGVNTTVDVGPNEIKTQAAKFGNTVDKDGYPPTHKRKVKGSSTNVLFNLGEKKELEDYHPNERPRGPEFKPTMPKGTVKVDVSDVYDWYKLGQHISDLKGLGKHDFGKGPPSAILAFGDENVEHEYIKALAKIGLDITDIDPKDPKQPKTMKRVKTDPTYNVEDSSISEFAPVGSSGGNVPPRGPKTPGRDPWGGNDGGEDPYSKPVPKYYEHSVDFFSKFEADHFDDEVFDEKTGTFKGYWDDEEGRVQIAYFKFDNPQKTGSSDPGMGWYYEPQNESVAENFADGKKPGRKGLAKRSGVNCKQSVTKLRKIAKNSSGEKRRMAHWCANMKSGKD